MQHALDLARPFWPLILALVVWPIVGAALSWWLWWDTPAVGGEARGELSPLSCTT